MEGFMCHIFGAAQRRLEGKTETIIMFECWNEILIHTSTDARSCESHFSSRLEGAGRWAGDDGWGDKAINIGKLHSYKEGEERKFSSLFYF